MIARYLFLTTHSTRFDCIVWVHCLLSLPIRLVCWLMFRTIPHYVPTEWLALGPTCFDIWLPGTVLPILDVGPIFFLSLFFHNAHPGVLLLFVLVDHFQCIFRYSPSCIFLSCSLLLLIIFLLYVTLYFAYEHCVLPSSSSQALHLHTTRLSAKLMGMLCLHSAWLTCTHVWHSIKCLNWLHAMQ